MEARVHRMVGSDRELPEKVMVDQELLLEIVGVLEGSTSLPDWMVDQNQDREVLIVNLVLALASWTGSNREFLLSCFKYRERSLELVWSRGWREVPALVTSSLLLPVQEARADTP